MTVSRLSRLTLLRIREERVDQPTGAVFRFSLEVARGRRRREFDDLAQLVAFLNALAERDEPGTGGDPSSPAPDDDAP
jgi:hypothetical protein